MTNPSGLMMTIASDEEIEAEEDTDSGGESEQQPGTLPKTAPTNAGNKRGRPKKGRGSVEKKHAEVDPGFSFDVDSSLGIAESQAIKGWDFKSAIEKLAKQDPNRARSSQVLDARIAAKRAELRKGRIKTNTNTNTKTKPAKVDAAATEENDHNQDDDDQNGPRAKRGAGVSKDRAERDVDRMDEDGDANDEVNGDEGSDVGREREEASEEGQEVDQDENEEGMGELEEDNLREIAVAAGSRGKRLEAAKRRRQEASKDEGDDEDGFCGNGGGVEGGDRAQDDEDEEDEEEARKAAEFFGDGDENDEFQGGEGGESGVPFQRLNLSRPLLRAVEAMGFVNPTPIQQRAVPLALAGRDVCASAMTGSGKTAAFLLPVLERLLFRPKKVAVTRVMIVTPTRELGVQIHSMCLSLCQFTDITCVLIVGGNKNLRAQEAELRAKPDIVVCSPGRMVDHLTNSTSVHVDDVEILVLDEADRLLELGFQEEVKELVRSCPAGRQTLLFSATMNTKVDDLATLALNKPVRVRASPLNSAPQRLAQEFIRIRRSREQDREAILLSLLARTFMTKTIVFFDTKVLAHRLNIVLGLAGIKAAELHGNLAMTQRLEALDRFKSGDITVLVATDLAARGLDIAGVHTVINFEMPRSADSYIHRVGRTARAGCGGRSVTLIGESRRIVMKEVLKTQGGDVEIKSRAVPQSAIDHYRSKIEGMESSVKAILADEKVEREARCAEMEADRASNMMEHQKEILSRPKRQWIVSEHRKGQVVDASNAEAAAQALKASGQKISSGNDVKRGSDLSKGNVDQGLAKKEREKKLHRMTRKKRRRIMAMEADERQQKETEEELKAQGKPPPSKVSSISLVRSAKKDARALEKKEENKPLAQMRGTKRMLEIGSASAFDVDLNARKVSSADNAGEANAGRAKAQPSDSRYNFTEFDPNRRLKRGAKKGSAKFKSKSKFKRKK